jgi:ATP diphosphatase
LRASHDIKVLLDLMAALRTPVSGCPWDLDQNFETIAPYTIEEAYEVADAIARNDFSALADELGDLLLQVVFHARMAEEVGAFNFGDVVYAITEKLIRRHPHVFGDKKSMSPEAVKALWSKIKNEERLMRKGTNVEGDGILSGIALALPALSRAEKLQKKAADVGFDWPSIEQVKAKISEELQELYEAKEERAAATEEVGDVLFAIANYARHLNIDPEAALRSANQKFERRFAVIETVLKARGKLPEQSSLQEMDLLWNEAKSAEQNQS